MRAIEIAEPGGPEVLRLVERPDPIPSAGEVLIRVAAAGVSRPDAHQRRGFYPPPPGASDLPGLEVAGTVAAVGAGVDAALIGTRVVALLAGGGYAERATAPIEQVLPAPSSYSDVEAAAVPENTFTVFDNLVTRGRLRAGESVLIHGGTSGIGTTAIGIARARGARVFVTAGSAEKCARAVELGAHAAIDYRKEDFVDAVRAATDGRGVDLILDIVAGDYVDRDLDALAIDGRLVVIAFQRSPEASFNVFTLMAKRLTITGSTLRARSKEQKGEVAAALRRELWPLLESRQIVPAIDSTFPLERAADAHRRLESGEHIGKIVLLCG